MSKKVLKTTLKINDMSKLKNTPWKVEVDYDGTCEIFATDKTRERGLRWIGSAIDESTAHAIAALPETLAELERVKGENDELIQVIIDYGSPWLRDQMRRILRETKD